MTIRKGQEWGCLVLPSHEMMTVHSDAELRALVIDGHRGPIGLLGGDMMRTVGGTGDASRFHGEVPVPHLPIDIVRATVDERDETLFVAHLVAVRSWWRGPITAVMNAQFRGDWDVAPRSHPNDGKFDVVSVSKDLGVQQRWMARSRVHLGNHVPHPMITIAQKAAAAIELDTPTPIITDGVRCGTARRVALAVQPDAVVVCV